MGGQADDRRKIAAGRIRGDPVLQSLVAAASNVPGGLQESQIQQSILGPIAEGSPGQRRQASENLLSIAAPAQLERSLQRQPITPLQQAQLDISERTATSGIDLNDARVEDIGIDNLLALDQVNRDIQAQRVTSATGLQTALQGNKIINTAVNGAQRLMQLERTLNDPRASGIDMANAAVLLTQILEPGLATRNDDRMAVESGATSGLVRLSNEFNQWISGEIDFSTGRARILRTARNLIRPLVHGADGALSFYQRLASDIPGINSSDIFAILGIDEQTSMALAGLVAPPVGAETQADPRQGQIRRIGE